ncbi:conserved membrane protein of unknown function [Candidatus Nitrosotalea okcheonensis]|uniref:Uncharacterized protein n=1 Tax=Candidatus Nitrosotalea okcheonensis TaxID=1903276 RepID=A0A2H1FDJ5_9ARCH|nr:conserved membrane protein of unknown function [Candidatus Nitrosotalea okcheonensis]
MVFYEYFSAHWIGSLGLVSSLMFVLIFLAHKQKLGRFGNLFLSQMTKTIKGKSGKVAITLSLVLIAYFTSTLVWIERGNTVYSDEKHLISNMLFSNYDTNKMSPSDIHKIMDIKQGNMVFDVSYVNYADHIISMTYAIMNDMMGGWMVNLDTILLVEQFEFLVFIIVYRKIYNLPKTLVLN